MTKQFILSIKDYRAWLLLQARNDKVYLLLPGLLILIGIGLRVGNWKNYEFGFDQVQIMENAEAIARGDWKLVGPRTGPGGMFTGPLIYYLGAVWWKLIGFPKAIPAMVASFSLITGVTIWLLGKKYAKAEMLWIVLLWAVSPWLINLDRTLWNPNLSLLAGVLVFLPMYGSVKKGKLKLTSILLISIGIFLGYQAHFSGLILLPVFVLAWMIFFRWQWLGLILPMISQFLTLAPTIIFEARNNWVVSRALGEFLDSDVGPSAGGIVSRLVKVSLLGLENMSNVMLEGNRVTLVWLMGILAIGSFWFVEKAKSVKILVGIWVMGFVGLVSLYRGSIPPYYLLMQLPAFLLILSKLARKFDQKIKYGLMLVVLVYSVGVNLDTFWQKNPGLSLGNQMSVAGFVNSVIKKGEAGGVTYDMELANDVGLAYLIKTSDDQKPLLHVAYPTGDSAKIWKKFGNISIWLDPRVDENKNYLELDGYILETPRDIYLLNDGYAARQYNSKISLAVVNGNVTLGYMVIYHRETHKDEYKHLIEMRETRQKQVDPISGWLWTENEGQLMGIKPYHNDVLLYIPNPVLSADYKAVVDSVVVHNGEPRLE